MFDLYHFTRVPDRACDLAVLGLVTPEVQSDPAFVKIFHAVKALNTQARALLPRCKHLYGRRGRDGGMAAWKQSLAELDRLSAEQDALSATAYPIVRKYHPSLPEQPGEALALLREFHSLAKWSNP